MEQRQQLEIDFSRRGYQLRLLDGVRFGRGLGCGAASLVLVLRGIDSFAGEAGWCFACLDTIAQRCNLNERTVRRAIEILVSMYLVRKQMKRGRSGNLECRYQICWSNLDAYIEDQTRQRESDIEVTVDQWVDIDPMEGGNGQFAGGATDNLLGGQRTISRGATDSLVGGQRTICPGATDNLSGGNGQSVRGQRTESPLGNGQRVHLTAMLTANEPPPTRMAAEEADFESVETILATRLKDPDTVRRLARNCDPETAADVIVEFDDAKRAGLFSSPGAIAWRLETGQWPHDGVRNAAEIRAAKEATERRLATERAAQAARERDRKRATTTADELETRYGPILDGMSPEERDAFARTTLGEWLFGRWKSGKSAEVCREQMLEAMANGKR
jgi:hypothetical protein